jgi:hypothetical protein
MKSCNPNRQLSISLNSRLLRMRTAGGCHWLSRLLFCSQPTRNLW